MSKSYEEMLYACLQRFDSGSEISSSVLTMLEDFPYEAQEKAVFLLSSGMKPQYVLHELRKEISDEIQDEMLLRLIKVCLFPRFDTQSSDDVVLPL